MKSLQRLFVALALVVSTYAASSVAKADEPLAPVVQTEQIDGIYAGWGWYPVVNGLWWWDYYGYPVYDPYGYSYWGYWNYAPFYRSFGAIAYSPATNRVGIAWGQFDLRGAAAAATGYCAAPDCQPVVWTQGGCAAVAKSPADPRVAWGYHTDRYRARVYAMRACQASGAPGCEIGAWVCSY